jgi:pimeloyl-ACP methyl ester carboxylesterase
MPILGRLLQAFAIALIAVGAGLGISAGSYYRDNLYVTSRGIQEAQFVRIGGIDQWVQIRGDDRDNPVLLWLNGGVGASTISSTPQFREWEKHFTIVMWDQRGEGRTFTQAGGGSGGPMTVAQISQDGIELADYLRQHLHKDKIILLGHDWGSVIGVNMVKARPDLFAAYVGTGQLTQERAMMAASYPLLIERAREHGNWAAVGQLQGAGPPPWPSVPRAVSWFIWASALDPKGSPRPFTLSTPWSDIMYWNAAGEELAGLNFSRGVLAPALMDVDLPALGPKFGVPVVIIQGSEDLTAPTALTRQYFDSIVAPSKDFVTLAGAGHRAPLTDSDRFLTALLEHVRPLVVPNH